MEKRKGEKHQCVVVSCMPPTRDLAHNPGLCPDWEPNLLVCRPALNPLSYTSQDSMNILMCPVKELVGEKKDLE